MEKIGFVGFGKMGKALLKGIKNTKELSETPIFFTNKQLNKTKEIEKKYAITYLPLPQLFQECSILVICVKPNQLADIAQVFNAQHLESTFLISVLAGKNIEILEDHLGKTNAIARVMPNTAITIGEGMTAISHNKNVTPSQKKWIHQLFSALGEIEELPDKWMDVATAISGSGPAFIYEIAEAVARQGSTKGIPYQKSLQLFAQTLIGAGKMLKKGKKTPRELIQDIKSPNGTTEAGLKQMDVERIPDKMKKVIEKTIQRAKELAAS